MEIPSLFSDANDLGKWHDRVKSLGVTFVHKPKKSLKYFSQNISGTYPPSHWYWGLCQHYLLKPSVPRLSQPHSSVFPWGNKYSSPSQPGGHSLNSLQFVCVYETIVFSPRVPATSTSTPYSDQFNFKQTTPQSHFNNTSLLWNGDRIFLFCTWIKAE